mgnify:FL=1
MTYTETVANRFMYAGEQFDEATGQYYLRARHYDPATSRMLTEDIYRGDIEDPQSLNLYTYCENNPIKYIDPSGYKCMDAIAGWAKSVDDALFFGAGGWISNKIRKLFGAEENDWEYLKSNNKDFATTYKTGSYTNAVYGVVNLAGGLKKIITSGGEAIVNNSGEIIQVVSGTVEGIIQAAKGAGITLISAGNASNSGNPEDEKRQDDINKGGSKGSKGKGSNGLKFGSTTKSAEKLANQMSKRGWTETSVNDTVNNAFTTRTSTNLANNNPATAYFNKDGSYVVVDNVTKEVVQVSNRLDPKWIPDSK